MHIFFCIGISKFCIGVSFTVHEDRPVKVGATMCVLTLVNDVNENCSHAEGFRVMARVPHLVYLQSCSISTDKQKTWQL